MNNKIVVSAINLFEGGGLSVLKDCLVFLDNELSQDYDITVFVHKSSLLNVKHIRLIEVPKSRKSYMLRLFYEFIWFYFQSLRIKPYLWFSLHDITPNVKADIRVVYCHNPSPFYKISAKEFLLEPTFGLFNKFYKLLYSISINKNKFIVVQQDWLRERFKKELNVISDIVVARPSIEIKNSQIYSTVKINTKPVFFYPTFPRVFKNIECLCEAGKILELKNVDVEIIITISGEENSYSKRIFEKYKMVSNIHFIGRLSRDEVFEKYKQCDALIFPSKLETWGLPISEAKIYKKPIFLADLPYAHETVGDYKLVSFFKPDDSQQLASLMCEFQDSDFVYEGNLATEIDNPKTHNWGDLFSILLK